MFRTIKIRISKWFISTIITVTITYPIFRETITLTIFYITFFTFIKRFTPTTTPTSFFTIKVNKYSIIIYCTIITYSRFVCFKIISKITIIIIFFWNTIIITVSNNINIIISCFRTNICFSLYTKCIIIITIRSITIKSSIRINTKCRYMSCCTWIIIKF